LAIDLTGRPSGGFVDVLGSHERSRLMAAQTVSVLDELRKLGLELDPEFLRQGVTLLMRLPWMPRCTRSLGPTATSAATSAPPNHNGYRERIW
jgi:hypothetical protein